MSTPTPAPVTANGIQDELQKQAERLIATAAVYGFVITITERPRKPLAMGNYDSVAEVRSVWMREK